MRRSMSPAASSARTLRTSPDSIQRPLRRRPLRRPLQRLRQARAVRRPELVLHTRRTMLGTWDCGPATVTFNGEKIMWFPAESCPLPGTSEWPLISFSISTITAFEVDKQNGGLGIWALGSLPFGAQLGQRWSPMWSYECPESSIFIQYDKKDFAAEWPSQIAVLAPKMKKLSKFVGAGKIAGRGGCLRPPPPSPSPPQANAAAPCHRARCRCRCRAWFQCRCGHGSNADADARRQRGWQTTCASATSRRAAQEGEERPDGGQCRHRNRLGLAEACECVCTGTGVVA